MMTVTDGGSGLSLLDVVALLRDFASPSLLRGQVGTVVERLNTNTWLVEFSDDDGHAFAMAACNQADLLVLHYAPEPA